MAGTLDIEEAFAKAEADINNEGDSKDEADNSAEDEVTETEGETPEEESEPVKEESEEQAFTASNPDELPEELKPIYKSLQADYTRKTQELAEQRKATDSRVKELEERLNALTAGDEKEGVEPTPEDQLRAFVQQTIDSKQVAEYRNRAIADYNNADPRLDTTSESYDKAVDLYVGQEMDARLQEHIDSGKPEYSFNHKAALKEVLTGWDDYLISKQKAFLQEQQKQAKAKAQEVKKQSPKSKESVSTPRVMDLDDAIAAAQKKLS